MSQPFMLKNGSMLVSTEAPGGLYSPLQLKKIAEICARDNLMLKATEDQRLSIIVDAQKLPNLTSELKMLGIGIRPYQSGLHQPVSCIGALCPDHQADALDSAIKTSAALQDLQTDAPLKIGINGCAKCCVPCHTLDISVVGSESGYSISIGGKNTQIPELASFAAEGIPALELPGLLNKLVATFNAHREESENLHAVIERLGPTPFIQALAPYSQDAASSQDPFAQIADEEEAVAPASEDKDEAMFREEEAVEIVDAGDLDINPSADSISETTAGGGDGDILIEQELTDSSPENVDISPQVNNGDELNFDLEEPEVIEEEPIDIEEVQAERNMSAGNEDEEIALEDKLEESIAEQKVLESVSKDENLEDRDAALGIVEGSAQDSGTEEYALEETAEESESIMDDTDVDENSEGCKAVQFRNGKMTVEFLSGTKVSLNIGASDHEKTLHIAGKIIKVKRVTNGIQAQVDGMEIFFPLRNAA